MTFVDIFYFIWTISNLYQKCGFCESLDQEGEDIKRVRPPFPDLNREHHYCSLEETPRVDREVDDFQPRVQLRKLFEEGRG